MWRAACPTVPVVGRLDFGEPMPIAPVIDGLVLGHGEQASFSVRTRPTKASSRVLRRPRVPRRLLRASLVVFVTRRPASNVAGRSSKVSVVGRLDFGEPPPIAPVFEELGPR